MAEILVEKKRMKKRITVRGAVREEQWLNDMLQKGWLLKKVRMGVYTFEECADKDLYISVCRMLDYDDEVKINPEFGNGRKLCMTGFNKKTGEYSDGSLGYFLFTDNGTEKTELSHKNQKAWLKRLIEDWQVMIFCGVFVLFLSFFDGYKNRDFLPTITLLLVWIPLFGSRIYELSIYQKKIKALEVEELAEV